MATLPPRPRRPASIPAPPGRSLEDDIQFLKGVGPAGARTLGRLGLRTAGDLLRHYPRRYEDRRSFRRIADLRPGEWAVFAGRVAAADKVATSRRGFTVTRVLVDDGSGAVLLVFFQQPYLVQVFEEMARRRAVVAVYGQVRRSGFGPAEIERAEWEELGEEGDALSVNRIVPVYPATEGIRQGRLRRIVHGALQSHLPAVLECLPSWIRTRHGLLGAREALRAIHFPESFEERDAARRRLVFEEFFLLQVALARRRLAATAQQHGARFEAPPERIAALLRRILPFELTRAQVRAIADIAADVASGHAMNRLLQGDVGSGKTVVALAAILMAVESGFQAALMAPTEILAQQHAIVLGRMLEPLGIPVTLAIGSLGARAKEEARARIAGGAPVAVGTHALIQEGVEFPRLGLAIVDEQHRFGVLQRQALHRKGERPHVLVMTATPIPRTLTMTLYGDLDTSLISELPPGRKPIRTHWRRRDQAGQVYAGMERLLREGRQAYVVCPLVEESEKLQARAATQLAEHIRREVLPSWRVGLLHGQLRPDEKEAVMRQFKAHEIDVLVATTVIEVGIDVPNATVMVIEDADRFGLAQLHQLRGRVGRGEHASYCILLADARSEEARARMQVMVETTDGFRIAEEDLKLRGPGEFFGTKQSGMPELHIADLLHDVEILDETRRAAQELVAGDPNLAREEHQPLRLAVERGRAGFELVTVS